MAALAMSQASAQDYGNSDYNRGYGYGHTRVVRCESIGSRRNFCRVETRGTVRISRQLSQRSCIQGRNWSYNSQGIWVTGGCRADFAISSRNVYRNSNGYSNRYTSNQYGTNYGSGSTYANGDNGYRNNDYRNNEYRDSNSDYRNSESGHTHYVDSSGQLIHCQATADGRTYCGDHDHRYVMSGTRDPDCIEGQTWGRDDRGTWVSGDCNADFSIDQNYDYQH